MGRLVWSLMAVSCVLVVVASCGGGAAVNNTSGTTGSGGAHTVSSSSSGTTTGSTGGMGGTGGAIADAAPPDASEEARCSSPHPSLSAAIAAASCAVSPPAGAPAPPPPKAYTGGTCPKLIAYDGTNGRAITSMGNARSFPWRSPQPAAQRGPADHLPLVLAQGERAGLLHQGRRAERRRQAALHRGDPPGEGRPGLFPGVNLDLSSPYAIDAGAARRGVHLLRRHALVRVAQYNVNLSCVSSAGVSAGALCTDQLLARVGVPVLVHLALRRRRRFHPALRQPRAGAPPAGDRALGWADGHLHPHLLPDLVAGAREGPSPTATSWSSASTTAATPSLPSIPTRDCRSTRASGSSPSITPTGCRRAPPLHHEGPPLRDALWCAIGAGNAVPRTGACGPPAACRPSTVAPRRPGAGRGRLLAAGRPG